VSSELSPQPPDEQRAKVTASRVATTHNSSAALCCSATHCCITQGVPSTQLGTPREALLSLELNEQVHQTPLPAPRSSRFAPIKFQT